LGIGLALAAVVVTVVGSVGNSERWNAQRYITAGSLAVVACWIVPFVFEVIRWTWKNVTVAVAAPGMYAKLYEGKEQDAAEIIRLRGIQASK